MTENLPSPSNNTLSGSTPSPARRPFRQLHGLLLLDKAGGITSNKALQQARHLFAARKAGHTGNLDPLATGMLPVCFGEATKVSAYLLDADKAYSAVARLGTVTDTGDSDGTTLSERPLPEGLDADALESVLMRFRGPIQQVPPMYSALKHKGKRLYELARAGKTVERKPRSVVISALELMDLQQGSFTIDVRCSKGTYIRSLVEDIGEALGCGAHLSALRRTAVSPFANLPMLTLDELQHLHDSGGLAAIDQQLLPVDAPLQHLPAFHLKPADANRFRQGNAILLEPGGAQAYAVDALVSGSPASPETSNGARVYTEAREFMGIGTVTADFTTEQSPSVALDQAAPRVQLQPRRVLNL